MDYKVLVVDDEKLIVKGIKFSLEQDNMVVDTAYDGEEALEKIKEKEDDIVLLDLGLPDMDGMDVLQSIRAWSGVPIIVISARSQEKEKVKALDAGADDYITKPFGTSELLARIRTALRHNNKMNLGNGNAQKVYQAKDLVIDFEKRRVFLNEQDIHLTQIEYKIVSLLAKNAGKVMTYDSMIADIWGPYADDNNRILRVNMANIRRKIETNPGEPEYIFTELGVGYRMLEDESISV